MSHTQERFQLYLSEDLRQALELIRRKGGDRSLAEALRRLIKEASR